MFSFHYLQDAPILSVEQFPELGGNINGPSLIRSPAWLSDSPARYLLYFAHHEGESIRLAVSDHLEGPWKLHKPDPLSLASSHFATQSPCEENLASDVRNAIEAGDDGNYPHIASPDIQVDNNAQQIRMYFHGREKNGRQYTRVALSQDGFHFAAQQELLGNPYCRVFRHENWYYAISMPAQLYRSANGLNAFQSGPCLIEEPIRHHAILQLEGRCYIFWTRVGDSPERVLVSELNTDDDWGLWSMSAGVEIHRPERIWEGATITSGASRYGGSMQAVNQLRDPAIFVENERIFLLYSVCGEQGIALGELEWCSG